MFVEVIPSTPIFGMDNIAYTATNLACIMGANKIVYVGFDQKSSQHYYEWPGTLSRMKKQVSEIHNKYKNDEFLKEDIRHLQEFLHKSREPDYLQFNTFFRNKFKAMFDAMRKNNVKPVVHNKHSIVFDAGAEFEEYDSKLKTSSVC